MTNTSFSSGLGAGLGIGALQDQRQRTELLQQQNQQQQQQLLRQDFLKNVETNLKTVADLNKNSTPAIFTEGQLETVKNMGNDARMAYDSAVKTGWESFLPMVESAISNGVISQAEGENIAKRWDVTSRLVDPRAAQALEASGEGAKAKAKAEGKHASEMALVQERGRQAQITAAVPRTSNVNSSVLQAQIDAQGGEGVQGLGKQIMSDIIASTGIWAAGSKALSNIFGAMVSGTNPRLNATQRVRNFNQEIKFAFSRNPKYPVAEIRAIKKNMLIDPDAIFVDPEAEAKRIIVLKKSLEQWNAADKMSLPSLTPNKAEEALERMGTRQTVIDMIGDVPSLEEVTGIEIDTLEAKVVDGTATDEEKIKYMDLVKHE